MNTTRRRINISSHANSGLTLFSAIVLCCVIVSAQTSTPVVVQGTAWATRFDGPAHHNDRDPVMTTETRSLTDNPLFATTLEMDIVTIKYNGTGVQQWSAVFDGEGNFLDYPNDIGVDSQGNVFVTGYHSD